MSLLRVASDDTSDLENSVTSQKGDVKLDIISLKLPWETKISTDSRFTYRIFVYFVDKAGFAESVRFHQRFQGKHHFIKNVKIYQSFQVTYTLK